MTRRLTHSSHLLSFALCNFYSCFNQSKYTSFQRQLNLYGFSRIKEGADSGGYYHRLFLRAYPDLCKHINRHHKRDVTLSFAHPNFYLMSSCFELEPSQRSLVAPHAAVGRPVLSPCSTPAQSILSLMSSGVDGTASYNIWQQQSVQGAATLKSIPELEPDPISFDSKDDVDIMERDAKALDMDLLMLLARSLY
jgi:hypothetical protein